MIQSHKILINRVFTSSTVSNIKDSDLTLFNSYYLTKEGTPDKIVDEYNVRGFLTHEKNQKIVINFFASLTGNPLMNEFFYSSNGTQFKASPSFKEIYYNDEKLAQSFNDYYNNSVTKGKTPTPSSLLNVPKFVENQLKNLSGEEFQYETFSQSSNYFLWNSAVMNEKYLDYIPLDFNSYTRNINTEDVIVTKPVGDNYLINVFIQKTVSQTAREIFEFCDEKIIKSISQGNIIFFNQSEPGIQFDIVNTININNNVDSTFQNITATSISNIPNSLESYNIDPGISPQEEVFPGVSSLRNAISETTNVTRSSTQNNITGTTGSTQLVQCFVDLNLSTDENELYFIGIPSISFESNTITVYEGTKFSTRLILSEPAIGSGSITINWIFYPQSIQPTEFEYGIPSSLNKTYYFSPGDEFILIDDIKISQDIFKYPPRYFEMNIVNPFNVITGIYPNLKIKVIDTTNWKDISFQPTGKIEIVNGISYVLHDEFIHNGQIYKLGELSQDLLDSNTFFTINIALDEPSEYGIEKFSLSFDKGTTFNPSEYEDDWTAWLRVYSSPVLAQTGIATTATLSAQDIDVFGVGGNFWEVEQGINQILFQQGEQVKTIAFQFLPNPDDPSNNLEYFDIKITNLESVEEGSYLNARIYIKDYTLETTEIN